MLLLPALEPCRSLQQRVARQALQRFLPQNSIALVSSSRCWFSDDPEKAASSRHAKEDLAADTDLTPRHWTEASSSEKHWLDRRLPGLREWLESKNQKLWLKGIAERCREELIQEQLSRKYTEYLRQYASLVVDERSQTHLQMGALMLATKHVLSPWIKDIRIVEDIIKSQMGDFTSPALRFLLRYTSYFARDPYLSTKRRLYGLRLDYGKAFKTEITEFDREAELHVKDCFYHSLFQAEGFENLSSHGISFQRKCWKGSGSPYCSLVISKKPKGS